MFIGKTAADKNSYRKPLYYFNSARNAFRAVLGKIKEEYDFTLFLPGYIGYSPKEGSGIYDPVAETHTRHRFYKIDRNLAVDVPDFVSKISGTEGKKAVLIVHYFGYPDRNIKEITKICREHDAIVIEDAAHALFTDFVDRKCGYFGDFVLYSIHKMLPYQNGGLLKTGYGMNMDIEPEIRSDNFHIFDYDFWEISEARKKNARLWNDLLGEVDDRIGILHSYDGNITPQTFPVLIKKHDRNRLYFELNDAGYGAVSLYHTMIDPVRNSRFEDAVWLSQHIMNLPVHQDIAEGEIEAMKCKMVEIMDKMDCGKGRNE